MQTGQKLQALRVQRGMTQEEVAERLYVSRELVSKWELGQRKPDIRALRELARLFSVEIDELADTAALSDELSAGCAVSSTKDVSSDNVSAADASSASEAPSVSEELSSAAAQKSETDISSPEFSDSSISGIGSAGCTSVSNLPSANSVSGLKSATAPVIAPQTAFATALLQC